MDGGVVLLLTQPVSTSLYMHVNVRGLTQSETTQGYVGQETDEPSPTE